jgi:hypothetical protein
MNLRLISMQNAVSRRFLHSRSFILLSTERGRKTKFLKKKSVGGSYKKLRQTDRQKKLIGSFAARLNFLKNRSI